MSTATMDAPSAPMQVEDDVSIGGSSASKDPANKAEEASAKPADKPESALKSFLSGGVGGELRFIDKKVAHVVLDLVNLRPIT